MGVTGKYDFQGLKKLNALGLRALFSSTPWLAWLNKMPALLDMLGNWAANKSLVLMNLGAISVNGEIDQKIFDRAIDEAWKQVEQKGRSNISPEEGMKIDEKVREAARRNIALNPRRRP